MAPAQSQPSHDGAIIAAVVSLIEKTMAEYRLPGLAIALVRAGQIVFVGGFGSADLATGRPVTPETLFNAGSVAKSFTALAVMQLIEEGKVALEANVTAYLPYFRLEDPRYRDITIRHLLSHTAGLPEEPVVSDPPWKSLNFDRPEVDDGALERNVRNLGSLQLLDNPGSQTIYYSNIGYNILGDIVAKVSGRSYEAYMAVRVLLPLGMKQSTFLPDASNRGSIACGYQRDAATGEVSAWPFIPYNRTDSPCGGLFASASDLSQAALALLNGGTHKGRQILQRQSLDSMWTPVVTTNFDELLRSYALGWVIGEVAGHRLAWHPGANPGFRCLFMLAPDDGAGVAVLVNSWRYAHEDEPSYPSEVAIPAMKMLLGTEG